MTPSPQRSLTSRANLPCSLTSPDSEQAKQQHFPNSRFCNGDAHDEMRHPSLNEGFISSATESVSQLFEDLNRESVRSSLMQEIDFIAKKKPKEREQFFLDCLDLVEWFRKLEGVKKNQITDKKIQWALNHGLGLGLLQQSPFEVQDIDQKFVDSLLQRIPNLAFCPLINDGRCLLEKHIDHLNSSTIQILKEVATEIIYEGPDRALLNQTLRMFNKFKLVIDLSKVIVNRQTFFNLYNFLYEPVLAINIRYLGEHGATTCFELLASSLDLMCLKPELDVSKHNLIEFAFNSSLSLELFEEMFRNVPPDLKSEVALNVITKCLDSENDLPVIQQKREYLINESLKHAGVKMSAADTMLAEAVSVEELTEFSLADEIAQADKAASDLIEQESLLYEIRQEFLDNFNQIIKIPFMVENWRAVKKELQKFSDGVGLNLNLEAVRLEKMQGSSKSGGKKSNLKKINRQVAKIKGSVESFIKNQLNHSHVDSMNVLFEALKSTDQKQRAWKLLSEKNEKLLSHSSVIDSGSAQEIEEKNMAVSGDDVEGDAMSNSFSEEYINPIKLDGVVKHDVISLGEAKIVHKDLKPENIRDLVVELKKYDFDCSNHNIKEMRESFDKALIFYQQQNDLHLMYRMFEENGLSNKLVRDLLNMATYIKPYSNELDFEFDSDTKSESFGVDDKFRQYLNLCGFDSLALWMKSVEDRNQMYDLKWFLKQNFPEYNDSAIICLLNTVDSRLTEGNRI